MVSSLDTAIEELVMASGPFTMAPGDTQEVVVAEICAGAVTRC